MKIAMISQVYPPIVSGAAVVVHGLANAMAERGHSVLVVTSSDEGPAYSVSRGGMEIVRVRSQPNPVRSGTRLAFFATRSVEEALEEFQPDVIHIHDPSMMGLWGLRYASEHAVPAVFSCHALPPLLSAYAGGGEILRGMLEAALWRYGGWFTAQCDLTIAPTGTIADLLGRRLGCRTRVISGGVDTDLFTSRPESLFERAHIAEKYGLAPGLPVILHVGRLDIEKKVNMVVSAAAAAMEQSPAQLVIVGDGVERESIETQVSALGLRDRVIFTGFLDRSGDLPAVYRMGDVFVTACDIETQGLVLLEAMASGVPVVAVRSGGIPDVVRHGVNGYLAKADSIEELAGGILAVLKHPIKAAKMGANARDMMEAHSAETTFDLYESVYRQLAGEGVVIRQKERMFY